ncbi:MAG: ATP-binding protein [Nitrososphaerales archaeon]
MTVKVCTSCGRLNDGKRFCPSCKTMFFNINNTTLISYFGVELGNFSNGLPFIFPPDRLSSHTAVLGQTGTGKTRLAMALATKTQNYPMPVPLKLLVIDIEGEWKGIIPHLRNGAEYYAIDRNFRINPFDLKDHGLIRELLRETVFKGIEKEYVDLSAQMNYVLNEVIPESSSMPELIQNVRDYNKERLTNLERTKTALKVRLDPFMRSPLKEIFGTKRSSPEFEKLDRNNIIIDLHALDALVAYNRELRLIYNTLSSYYLRKMLSNGTTDGITHLFVCDEAQLLVPKILRKLIVTESWPATEFATRLRKRGCGVMFITQSPSNIEKDIMRNVGTKFVFRIQDPEDLRFVSDSFGFIDITEYEYLANVLVKLQKRECVVQSLGNDPSLITSKEFEPAKTMPHIPHEFEIPITDTEVQDESFDTGNDDKELSSDEEQFLRSLNEHPFISTRQRRHLLGWNDKTYSSVVQSLVGKKHIEKMSVKNGAGAPRILYQVVGKNPSVLHEFYVHWISERLRSRGIDCVTSKEGPDIQIPSLGIAVNVETGNSDIEGNIRIALNQFSKIIICSDDEKIIQTISGQNKGKNVLCCLCWNVPDLIAEKGVYASRSNS